MPPSISGVMDVADSAISRFVIDHEGDNPIHRILVASNGLGALKGIRSIKNWAYEVFGNENVIEFIVMATKEDIEGNAEYIKIADRYVEVPPGPNNFNYANVDLIVSLAKKFCVEVPYFL